MVFQSWKKRGKIITKLWKIISKSVGKNKKIWGNILEIYPSSFILRKPFVSIANNKKVKFDRARCPFRRFCVSKVITTAHVHKSGVIFHFSSRALRGAWSDRDTNDIFAHCSLIFYYLDFKFSNFVCPSELHPLIWFFLKNSLRKKKNIQKTSRNALAPSIFIVLSIVLKLGTPLLHFQAQNTLLQNFWFRFRSRDMDEKLPKTLFYATQSALTKHNFFRRSKLKNL